jgi:phage FluMu protein Com
MLDMRCPNCTRLQMRLVPVPMLYVEMKCRGCKQEMVITEDAIITISQECQPFSTPHKVNL